MVRRFPLALVAFTICAAAHAQSRPAQAALPRVMGTETAAEFWYQRLNDRSTDANIAAFGDAPFHITFSITYQGLKLPDAPASVEVLLVREIKSGEGPPTLEPPPTIIIIDGLPVPLTRQTIDGPDLIKGVVSFEVFQWMVGGKTLEFEAFGRRFVLAARQVADLHTTALEWAHAARH